VPSLSSTSYTAIPFSICDLLLAPLALLGLVAYNSATFYFNSSFSAFKSTGFPNISSKARGRYGADDSRWSRKASRYSVKSENRISSMVADSVVFLPNLVNGSSKSTSFLSLRITK